MKKTFFALGLSAALLTACGQSSQPAAVTPVAPPQDAGAPAQPQDTGAPAFLPDPLTGQSYFSRQLVVGLEPGQQAQTLAASLGGRVLDELPQVRAVVLEFSGPGEMLAAARTLLESGQGLVAQNYRIEPERALDTAPASLLTAQASAAGEVFDALPQYALDEHHLHARAAWDARLTGKGVTVGVIDDPVDVTHPDLKANWGGLAYDPLTDKTYDTAQGWIDAVDQMGKVPMPLDNVVDEAFSHGTAVTSTIAAARDGAGIVGLAPDAKYLPAAMFQPGSVGSSGIAKAIIWQVDHGARVINNSWGGPGFDPLIKLAMDYALARGVVVVVSAGNESREYYQRPALYAGIIPSAALDAANRKASFSSFGRHISVGAPGVNILMASPAWVNADGTRKVGATPATGSGYTLMSGTSFSGPYTAAAAALIVQARPELDPSQVRRLLEETADGSVGDQPGFDKGTGHGLIRLDRVVARLGTGELPAPGGTLKLRVEVPKPDGTFMPIPTAADVMIEDLTAGEGLGPIYGSQTGKGGEVSFLALAPGRYGVRVGGPDTSLTIGGNLDRGTYVGEVEVRSGTTPATAETVTVRLDKGYVETDPTDPYEPNDTLETATPISFGQETQLAYIYKKDAAYDVDYFSFEGEAGKYINLKVKDKYDGNVAGTLWGYAILRDAAGKVVYVGSRAAAGSSLFVKLPATGRYYIQFGSYTHLQPSLGEDLSKGTPSNTYTNRYQLLLTSS
ncbi:S8 family serine peptidase [Deinococcus lacus]|uniref:S8 family serine peptidase n=1 Tax=Deinococcus lacus TaxID=392561 RepID=A0ABW1YEP3_9DEIO